MMAPSALIAGGSRSIGYGIARHLAKLGHERLGRQEYRA